MLFLVAYAWPILQPGLDDSTASALGSLSLILWAAFIVDYIVRVWLAEQRWRFVAHHVPDLAMLVLPMLRPLRALRAVMAWSRLNSPAAPTWIVKGATTTQSAAHTEHSNPRSITTSGESDVPVS